MTDNTLDRKPGEKAPGKYHYNPGNMAGKTVETGQDAGQLHPDACGRAWLVKVSRVGYMSSTATSPWARSRSFGTELSSSTWRGGATTPNWPKNNSKHWRRRKACSSLIGSALAKN
jgi:hypothetical protein